MKTMALIILLLFLLQPLACFAHSCDSCLGNPDIVDTSGKSEGNPHNQDADICDSTVCYEESIKPSTGITVIYTPLVSVIAPPERYTKLLKVVMPIFVPPQNVA
ncbi:MAG: hypothetical protein WCL71_12355 [Deltaproteobacteria bacterium]